MDFGFNSFGSYSNLFCQKNPQEKGLVKKRKQNSNFLLFCFAPIIDSYQIRIIIPDNYPDSIPFVQEIGGKAKAIVEKYGIIDPRDFHWNPGNGTACLCVKQQEKIKFPPRSTLVYFIENLVILYFMVLVILTIKKNGHGVSIATEV